MKTTPSLLLIAVLCPGAIFLASCAKTGDVQAVAQDTKAAAKDVVADVRAAASESWDSIKDYTYEKREDFAASLERMADRRDTEIQAMNAKLNGLPDDTAKERDRANKAFAHAHASLKAELAELRTGTADTWASAKEKVSEGWQRVQTAYDKVKSSPTS